MNNLLIYLNPSKKFDDHNSQKLVEVQIDNCLRFIKPQELLFVTNFPYEYHGIKSSVIPDHVFCEVDPRASKVTAVLYLLEHNLLPGLTWVHDLDAFQLAPIEISLEKDFGVADYGYKAYWNLGSIFIKPAAIDIYSWLRDEVYKRKANE